LELSFDASHAAITGQLSQTIDYHRLCTGISFILENARFGLLESAADAICRFAFCPNLANGDSVRPAEASITLAKPQALANESLAVPSITINRRITDYSFLHQSHEAGEVWEVFDVPGYSAMLVGVSAGAQLPLKPIVNRRGFVAMPLGSGTFRGDAEIHRGEMFKSTANDPCVLRNESSTDAEALLLLS